MLRLVRSQGAGPKPAVATAGEQADPLRAVAARAVAGDGPAQRTLLAALGPTLCWHMGELSPLTAEILPLPAAVVGITASSGIFCRPADGGCSPNPGEDHTCVWTAAGDLYCWGSNGYGQLGDGTTMPRADTDIVHATAPGGPVLSASAGTHQTCVIRASDRRLACWGWNGAGELGTGTGGPRVTPSTVMLP